MSERPLPFTKFNFKIEISYKDNDKKTQFCGASFSECDGIEMSMIPKTIREGGNNLRQIHLNGPVSYSTLTLKRGMTENMKLWEWFEYVDKKNIKDRKFRTTAEVLLYSNDRERVNAYFKLKGCIPIKLRAPNLNATDSGIAIEEMQIAYEFLKRENPTGYVYSD